MSEHTYSEVELAAALSVVRAARSSGAKTKAAELAAGVSANVADAISKIDDLIDELMDHLGIPDTDKDAGPGDSAAVIALKVKVAELEGQLTSHASDALQAKVDEAVVAMQAEKDRADALEQLIATAATEEEQRKLVEGRKAERTAKAKEVAGFTDEQLAEADADGVTRADRLAAMSDEAWEQTIAGWGTLRASKAGDLPPVKTALHAAAEGSDDGSRSSTLRKVVSARRGERADLRSLARR